jgi:glycosyltransferase involved in cell wall biosynthesis
MTDSWPFITVVMPVRNEARFIAGTVGQLLAQDYPVDRFEVIVADGMSDDGTRAIVAEIAAADSRLRLLDNPKRRSSAGRNVGFKAGRGELFVVVDGHCHIPNQYFLRNVADCFEKSGADCLGRPQPLDPPGLTSFQQGVALARASCLGHGGGSLIYDDFEGFSSPVSNGAAYRKRVFEQIGLVDEDFDACEDVEFNYRVEIAGLKTFTSPKLTVRYYPREDFASLFNQMRRYGRGRTRFYFKHPKALSASALFPAAFVGGFAAFTSLLLIKTGFGLSDVLTYLLRTLSLFLILYVILVCIVTARICLAGRGGQAIRLPFIFMAIHVGLGLGMWEELVAISLRKRVARRRDNEPIRIAFVIDAIETPTGGTERQLVLLLERLDRQRFDPRLCVLQDSSWIRDCFSLSPVHVLNIRSFKNPKAWWGILRFSRWLKREKIDIVQTHFRDASAVGIVAAFLARTPVVIATRKSQGFWMNNVDKFVNFFLNRMVTHFVANSESTRQWANRSERIAPEHITVIHNGLTMNIATGVDAQKKAKILLEIDPESPVIGIVANLRPVKRIDVFLHAAAHVSKYVSDVHFVVVGEGEGEQEWRLKSLSRELNIEERVHFLGRRTDVADLLPGFDVGVLSSDSESFSNSVVEYMAAGLPVAATDVGGCKEALEGSPAGILVPPGDAEALGKAMRRLLEDGSVREHARTMHRERVDKFFSHVSYVQSYENLFIQMFNKIM